MGMGLESSRRSLGNLLRKAIIKKISICLIVLTLVGGLKNTDHWLTRTTYEFIRSMVMMEFDYQDYLRNWKVQDQWRERFLQPMLQELRQLLPGSSGMGVIKTNGIVQLSQEEVGSNVYMINMPVDGEIVAEFGPRIHPVYGDERMHNGVDIAAQEGTLIKTVMKGVVERVEETPTYGKAVLIDHGDNIKTYYAHCSEILVEENQQVSKGETIAKVGNTGLSTNPHLHFEVWENGISINPYSRFSFLDREGDEESE